MIVYRTAKSQFIGDLSGTGARFHGGRWNHKGASILYTSESRALATVECLVHVSLAIIPANLSIASLEVPDDADLREISIGELPVNWRDYPAPLELAELGTQWALTGETLCLRVPSAVVQHEFNILINPLHTDMRHITLLNVEEYAFDDRLLKS
jgi:RES domain-containing protein